MRAAVRPVLVLLGACLCGAVSQVAAGGTEREGAGTVRQGLPARSATTALLQVIAAEDSRAATPAALDLLKRAAAGAPDLEVQRAAVRALGRLERPDLVGYLAGITRTADPVVRAELANALAQSVFGGDGTAALEPLLDRLRQEGHPLVRGVVAASLGRLALPDPAARERAAAGLLGTGWPEVDGRRRPASPAVLLGVLRGVESFAQRHRELRAGAVDLETVLREVAFPSASPPSASGVPEASAVGIATARHRAMSALVAVRTPAVEDVSRGLADADPELRRLAAAALARIEPYNTDQAALALSDAEPAVRVQALRALSSRADGRPSCEQALAAARDAALHVQLLGIELVGSRCRGNATAEEHLEALLLAVRAVDEPGACRPLPVRDWHRPNAALVALAQTGTTDLERWLPCFRAADVWRARAAAARALAARGDREALVPFFEDPEPNVRVVALELTEPGNLLAVRGALQALEGSDYELLLVAANKLQGATPDRVIGEAVAGALERVTAERKETSRDTRLALLDRLEEHGDVRLEHKVAPLVRDFDPVVAVRAAALVSRWLGRPVAAEPRPQGPPPLPSPAEFDALRRTRVVMVIDGGEVVVRLLAREAPLNAWRFARLARSGYYTRLTLHRVVANFIVQGGSPGANEHSGDGPFTRDEVGLQSNVRGSVGLSTRGRDTGDGQFYVNLVDNPRLDFTYTVFGQVERGMEVLDGVAEGAVIERVTVEVEPEVR